MLCQADGRVESVTMPSGRILGCDTGPLKLTDTTVPLASGETLILYTDGFTEAFSPDGESMFGRTRLQQTLAQHAGDLPIWAERLRDAVVHFTGAAEPQDDLTLFMLRRGGSA
jgi:serine phosphatase RsbU (regulator of sigma subunit)